MKLSKKKKYTESEFLHSFGMGYNMAQSNAKKGYTDLTVEMILELAIMYSKDINKQKNKMNKLLANYNRLESRNDHTEAAMLLVKSFGTQEEVEIIEGIMQRQKKLGYIENADRELRYQTSQKYYKLLHQKV